MNTSIVILLAVFLCKGGKTDDYTKAEYIQNAEDYRKYVDVQASIVRQQMNYKTQYAYESEISYGPQIKVGWKVARVAGAYNIYVYLAKKIVVGKQQLHIPCVKRVLISSANLQSAFKDAVNKFLDGFASA